MPSVKTFLSLALAAASTLASLALAEIAVRFVRPQALITAEPGLYQADPPLRYRLTPNYNGRLSNLTEFDTAVRINAQGMRDPVAEGSTGARRVLVIGDSFTFGFGVEVEDGFVSQLAKPSLDLPQSVLSLNGGVPGYGLPDEAAWLERYGLELEPDLVLLAVFMGNDLLDATEKHSQVTVTNGLVAENGFAVTGPRRWLEAHSHLTRLIKRTLPVPLEVRLRSALGWREPWATTYRRDAMEAYALTPSPLAEEGRSKTRAALERLVELTRGHSIPLAMVLIPDEIQVNEARWQRAFTWLGLDPGHYAPEVVERFFTELAGEHGLPLLDLSMSFRTAIGDGEKVYFETDPHWNTAGHHLAARLLRDFVAEEITRPHPTAPTGS